MEAVFFDPRSLMIFIGLSVVLGGAAAFSAGRALAIGWRPLWQGVFYALGVAAAVRFLHYALFAEPLLSPARFGLDAATALIFMLAGFYWTRRRRMQLQYGSILSRGD
ncbi:DUF6867 family protein [Methylocella silvestris]|uniref:DUF6867 domain-containing protein n=1 Tax=Methylocella silvestris TaxID=199596 RepID=A0A2J7THV2_METSI|nr:hypothetical protein [Methylocella silvestris]PNG26329.1 hypothetical protein CR492_09450 [Methylocella silvestris]